MYDRVEDLADKISTQLEKKFHADGEYFAYLKQILSDKALTDVTGEIQSVRESLKHIQPSVTIESQKTLLTEIKKSFLSMSATIKSEFKKNKEKLRESGIEINVAPIDYLIRDCNDLVLKLTLYQQQAAQKQEAPQQEAQLLPPARARSGAVRSNSSAGGIFSDKNVDESVPRKAQSDPTPANKSGGKPHILKRGGWGKN